MSSASTFLMFWRLPSVLKLGAIVGAVLLLAALAGLFWVENRTIRALASLEEGASNVVSVQPGRVDSANEGKLVHLSGDAAPAAPVSDPDFGIAVLGLRLSREVEIFQTIEQKKEEKKDGKTETKYYLVEDWSKNKPTQSFHGSKPATPNPADKPYPDAAFTAGEVQLGAFRLTAEQVGHLPATETLEVTEEMLTKLPANLAGKAAVDDDGRLFLAMRPAMCRTIRASAMCASPTNMPNRRR